MKEKHAKSFRCGHCEHKFDDRWELEIIFRNIELQKNLNVKNVTPNSIYSRDRPIVPNRLILADTDTD